MQLSQMAGRDFNLIYPIHGKSTFQSSELMTMYRSLEIAEKPMKAGIYLLEYWVGDIFMCPMKVGRAEVIWDGSKVALLNPASWQGSVALSLKDW